VDGLPEEDEVSNASLPGNFSGLTLNLTSVNGETANITEEVEKGANLSSEESLEILEDFSLFHLLSFNFYYGWKDDQLAANKYVYLPEGMSKLAFLEKTEFAARIKKINNAGRVTVKFNTDLKDQYSGVLK
jgi:hypothetical protein